MAVAPGWRGRGVGSALLAALIEVARERGFDGLALSVEYRNRAVQLYRRIGFEVVADENGSYTMRLQL